MENTNVGSLHSGLEKIYMVIYFEYYSNNIQSVNISISLTENLNKMWEHCDGESGTGVQ